MEYFLIQIIRWYQRTVSPGRGLFFRFQHPLLGCRYYPSCSDYTIQALQYHGSMKGLLMSTWRLMRCNPWSRGGVDEVPKPHTHNHTTNEYV